ncbi:MAG: glycosyltransferase, partial [Terriglobales bacterium]
VVWQLLRGLRGCPDLDLTWIGAAGSDLTAGGRFISWAGLLARYAPGLSLPRVVSPQALAAFESRCNRAAVAFADQQAFDLVHNQGAGSYRCATGVNTPMLMTLHLARGLYSPNFSRVRPNLHLQCVSHTQLREYGATACCGCVPNGVALGAYPVRAAPSPSAPLLYLGRICREKGPDLAIRLARAVRRPLWIVGGVAPFPSHLAYFREAIAAALDADIRWLPPPRRGRKLELLHAAAAVVIPSRVAETSSLVAMEAAACGVPVLALRRGALPEVVSHGETGFLADDWEGLAAAASHLAHIRVGACRRRAELHFDAARMVAQYARLYRCLCPARASA